MPNWKKLVTSGSNALLNTLNVTNGITGSLFGSASWSNNTLTASYVNTLNQNVLITGSLTVGSTSLGANENTLVLGPSPAGGTGEGGQILFQAPGGTYTSASMWDNYQNQTRLLRGTNAGSDAVVASFNMHTKQVQFPSYNALNAFSGTPVAALGVNSNGDIITIQTGSGAGTGGGSTFQAGTNVDNRLITATGTTPELYGEAGLTFDGKTLTVTGEVTASGAIRSLANGAMYFRGGDDAEFWDINVANTVGIYGQQNADRAGLKLGSSGPTLFGSSSKFGIGTITPTLATLEVNGNIYATSFTGSLFGTSSWSNNSVTASTINTSGNSNNVIYYPTFVDTNSTGIARTLYTDNNSSIRVNPGLGYLYATQFIGTASWAGSSSLANTSSYSITASYAGTSSWANTSLSINTIRNNTNATFYPVFVDSNNSPSSNESLYTESTITFNPNIGSLNVTSITASLQGTSSWANNALSASATPNALITASVSTNVLTFTKGNGSTFSLTVNTGSGGGTPGGSDTYIQFNKSNTFAGTSSFTFNYQSQSIAHGDTVIASGIYSYAHGVNSLASGSYSYAQGNSFAIGNFSHAEGVGSSAIGIGSHVEGMYNQAYGAHSHAEGMYSVAYGNWSHAEGNNAIASGSYSHAEGNGTTHGIASHAEGSGTHTYGSYSHAEGNGSTTIGDHSHAEGKSTIASGSYSHAEGTNIALYPDIVIDITAITNVDFDFGSYIVNSCNGYDIVIPNNITGDIPGGVPPDYTLSSFTIYDVNNPGGLIVNFSYYLIPTITNATYNAGTNETTLTLTGLSSTYQNVDVGASPTANGFGSHVEGYATTANGVASHAEGYATTAVGNFSHAEGYSTTAYGGFSHTEGRGNIASGSYSHAEGDATITYGDWSHAEGDNTKAYGNWSHAEGTYTKAIGLWSHASGKSTVAYGNNSLAAGDNTIASGSGQVVVGTLNKHNNTTDLFVIGGGYLDFMLPPPYEVRQDVFAVSTTTITMSGSVNISGSLLVNGSTPGGSTVKAGSGSAASFGGNPKTGSITFGSAFSNNNYAVTVTGEDGRSFSIQSKSSTGFTINTNSSVALTGPVYWIATPFGS